MGFIFEQGFRTYPTEVDTADGFSFDQTGFASHIVVFSIDVREVMMPFVDHVDFSHEHDLGFFRTYLLT